MLLRSYLVKIDCGKDMGNKGDSSDFFTESLETQYDFLGGWSLRSRGGREREREREIYIYIYIFIYLLCAFSQVLGPHFLVFLGLNC